MMTLGMYMITNFYKMFSKNDTYKTNVKKDLWIEGILILSFLITYFTLPILNSISLTGYFIILLIAILHWIINIVLACIFFSKLNSK